ncbi:farnesyl-diphosphate farnesyltransferase [Metarhizium robertsii ARSEF 23]|uniref:Squalene synthase n=1 Tax=Metarhizium robertsii (strain ARSEF 23 / ATCC MYA-3075) TaxID=655844 RepID=E9F2S8_METRA|nr:farnesyl-diphosphate farnesyltransferase [Metarhizium robertsii ARSEF 23]EFY97794.2 farnesyl-diphosphate farnesyltransferase [Metarhizium robertsii ARSEF 23]
MGLVSQAIYFAFHPHQLRMIIEWKLWHNPLHKRDEDNEPTTAKICYKFLDQTSRSFSPVIKELHPELRLPICVFYLVLRGLDTIEDDTSISLKTKEPLLRDFHNFLDQDGWTFTCNRPEEKDRELLVQFHNVITEFKKIKPAYQAIIKDITSQMGNGMADFVRKSALGDVNIKTLEAYDLYCWYVAGVVGEGLTRLIVEANMGDARLVENAQLYKSMGLLLQKNNITRDVREDFDDNRCFWPQEIWSKHVDKFEDLFKPEYLDAALNCSSEMVLNALRHTCDCFSYLKCLHDQSVFNFCAIPQSMAMATFELCFRNPAMFQRNIKIPRGDAFQLMIESSRDISVVCAIFRRYSIRIQQKNDPADPNFAEINKACEKACTLTIKSYADTIGSQQASKMSVVGTRCPQGKWSNPQLAFASVAITSTLVLGAAWVMKGQFEFAWP